MLKRWMFALASVTAMCATLAVSVGTASASTNVLTAIQQQNHVISASGTLAKVTRLEKADHKNPRKLAKAFDKLAGQFEHAATVVSRSSADSRRQAEGRRDWVLAVRDISSELYKLGHAFNDIARGNDAGAAKLLKVAEHKAKAGLKLGHKAAALLDSSAGF